MKNPVGRFFCFSVRYGKVLWAAVLLLSLLAVWQLTRTRYSTDMRDLLPADSVSARNLETVVNSGLTNKITLYISRKDGKTLDNAADMAAMSKFAEELRRTDRIDQVVSSPTGSSPQGLYADFATHVPALFSPSDLPRGDRLDSCLKENFKSLCLDPVNGALRCRYDPAGWTTRYLMKLENLLKISGLKFYAGNNSFILSPDRKVCMMLLYTDVTVSDYEKSLALLTGLQKMADRLPGELQCSFFSPHLHMLENARVMKADLWIFAICTSVLFLLLFALVYKFDWHGIIIPFIASLGGLWAAAVTGVIFTPVLLFSFAMGGILIGIAGDYGIHLYAASLSGRRVQNGIALVPKLFLAFFTSAFAFFCFIFTGVPAFVQFGTYSALTLFFSFLLLMCLLPGSLFFRKRPRRALDFYRLLHLERISVRHARIAAALLAVLAIGSFFVKISTDMRKFDVAYETIGKAEAQYREAFGESAHPCVLFYRAESFDALLEKCRRSREHLQAHRIIRGPELVTPSDLFTPRKVREENLKAWRAYLGTGEWAAYRKEFAARGEKYGFSPEFFSKFFAGIERGAAAGELREPDLLAFARMNMIGKGSQWTGIALVGAPENRPQLAEDLRRESGGVVFSEESFTRQLFHDISGKLPAVIPLVVLIVLASTLIHLRSPVKTLLVFLPVSACLIGIAGFHGLLGREITLAVMVSGIITIGISIDYGILLVDSDMSPHLFNAVIFSALTTAAGGMTVLFTHHPMLRAAGLTIIAGILSSCFFTICLLYPALKKLDPGRIKKGVQLLVCTLVPLLFSGCTSLPREQLLVRRPVPEKAVCRFPVPAKREFQGSLLLDYRTGQVAFLIAGQTAEDGGGDFSGLSPAGIKLFSLSGRGFELREYRWHESTVPENRQKELSTFLYRAIAAGGSPPGTPRAIRSERTSEGGVVLTGEFPDGGRLSCLYSGGECRIVKKEYSAPALHWLAEYCRTPEGSDVMYLYSDRSFYRACVKLKFFE